MGFISWKMLLSKVTQMLQQCLHSVKHLLVTKYKCHKYMVHFQSLYFLWFTTQHQIQTLDNDYENIQLHFLCGTL